MPAFNKRPLNEHDVCPEDRGKSIVPVLEVKTVSNLEKLCLTARAVFQADAEAEDAVSQRSPIPEPWPLPEML
jgi:hypothetical protein